MCMRLLMLKSVINPKNFESIICLHLSDLTLLSLIYVVVRASSYVTRVLMRDSQVIDSEQNFDFGKFFINVIHDAK